MAKNKDNDLAEFGFEPEATADTASGDVDLSEFGFEPEEAPTEEPSALETIGLTSLGQTAQDVLTGTAGSTLGRFAGGLSSGLTELLSKYVAPESDVDKQLREQGFKVKGAEADESAFETFKRGYYGGKESLEAELAKARERSPIATTLGEIGSEIGAGSAVAKGLGVAGKTGSKIKDLAKLLGAGATEGAASELARGEAKLLEGDIAGTAEELGEGTVFGLATAGLAEVASPAIKAITGAGKAAKSGAKFVGEELGEAGKLADPLRATKKLFTRAMRPGSGGIKGIGKEVQGRAKSLADNIVTTVRGSRGEIGKKLGGLKALATEQADVALGDSFDNIGAVLDDFATKVPAEASKTAKDLSKVRTFVDSVLEGADDINKVDLKKAVKISDELKRMTTNFLDGAEDIKDKELLALMRDFSKKIDDSVDSVIINQLQDKFPDRVAEFVRNKEKYRALSDLEAYAGLSTMGGRIKVKGAEKTRAAENLVKKLSDETYDIKAMMAEKEMRTLLEEAGLGKFAKEIEGQIGEINAGVQVLQYLNPQGAGLATSVPRSAAATAISSAGKVAGKVQRAAKPLGKLRDAIKESVGKGADKASAVNSSVSNWLKGSDSKAVQELADAMESAGKMRFSKAVKSIAETKDPVQKAIRMHALMQQPAFRQDLRATIGIDDEE